MPLLIARPIPVRVGLDFTKALFSPSLQSAHVLVWGLSFGIAYWQSFIGGITAYKALPRRDFGKLQSKLFPVYFTLTTGATAFLAASFAAVHHGRILKANSLADPTVFQTILLAGAAVGQAVNTYVLGPKATQVMFKRHALEAAEGKDYTDPTASAQMKNLTKEFGALHGQSTLINMVVVLALTAQGFWLSNFGL
ncbi:hypothetical protein OC846_004844 [Tilletia horrida]|uniref:TMEM205-like domain-containing protein n=1 Tax=Tilletia horrida TaxID=155126 RepID=A0AAN6JQS8_9BASI|nr:hypothetical protein OC846_004844 [Tilletia horrida]KAK0555637.1 hypothetical protein OC845_000208 [Tilletia horrida]KAK0570184.1 hypothetical protein OC861_000133 [Tilletia horrida]